MSRVKQEGVAGSVPGVESGATPDDVRQDAPASAMRRDTSGLERGPGGRRARVADRRRRAQREAAAELAELPAEMRCRLVRKDVLRKAKLAVLFDDAFKRISEANPIDARGEVRESFKWLMETGDRLHGWTESLLRAFPAAKADPPGNVEFLIRSAPPLPPVDPSAEVDAASHALATTSPGGATSLPGEPSGADGEESRAMGAPAPRPRPIAEPPSGDPLGMGWIPWRSR